MLIQGDAGRIPLADESVDLIFTDPPYAKEYLPLYSMLSQEAMRVLKPGAFILALCGGSYLNEVFRAFDESGLTFFWKYEMHLTGQGGGFLWPRGNTKVPIINRSKPILAYSKGLGLPRTGTLGVYVSNGADKTYHHWGQDVASARYFIDCFTREGDLVVDPLIGGGSTAVAAELIGRRWIGFDIKPEAIIASQRHLRDAKVPRPLPLFAEDDT